MKVYAVICNNISGAQIEVSNDEFWDWDYEASYVLDICSKNEEDALKYSKKWFLNRGWPEDFVKERLVIQLIERA